jgi:ADP-ribose pyrophosphatase
LVDKGESPETSAIRELYEETGYGGDAFEARVKVVELGGTVVSDPGELSPLSFKLLNRATFLLERALSAPTLTSARRTSVASQPGMSKANMVLATLEVELKEGEEEPKPHLDEGEHIEVRVVPLGELYEYLKACHEVGYVVDGYVYHFAAGLEVAKKTLGIKF